MRVRALLMGIQPHTLGHSLYCKHEHLRHQNIWFPKCTFTHGDLYVYHIRNGVLSSTQRRKLSDFTYKPGGVDRKPHTAGLLAHLKSGEEAMLVQSMQTTARNFTFAPVVQDDSGVMYFEDIKIDACTDNREEGVFALVDLPALTVFARLGTPTGTASGGGSYFQYKGFKLIHYGYFTGDLREFSSAADRQSRGA